jgi:hypothetical protein
MGTGIKTQVEKTFLSLPREERELSSATERPLDYPI